MNNYNIDIGQYFPSVGVGRTHAMEAGEMEKN